MNLPLDAPAVAFSFKASMLPFTVMDLTSADPVLIDAQLPAQISQSPAFFQFAPVVIGVERLQGEAVDLEEICAVCRAHNLLPVAVRGGVDGSREAAWALGLGWFPAGQDNRARRAEAPAATTAPRVDPPAEKAEKKIVAAASRTYRGTVRGGQQISAPKGDLIVIGAVNAGAEILAAGSVHVYGPLRGRALAGIHGDTEAGIFCRALHGELLAVAGHYTRSEDIDPQLLGTAVNVCMIDGQLKIVPLD